MSVIRRFAVAALCAATAATACGEARYIFYFIGDGMGMGHVNAAETYNRDVLKSGEPMLMLRFPVASQARTYSANKPITDSAAAGTALSTGNKTVNYRVGMLPDSTDCHSITRDFMRAGYAVGIATTVAGDDATPAAFYGHALDRKMSDLLGSQAAASGLTFLGAPAFHCMKKDGKRTQWTQTMERNGYTVVRGYDQWKRTSALPHGRILMLADNPQGDQAGYTIDSIPGALTAAQLTEACLESMTASKAPGFFMMMEGGNIDWAAHANDGGAVIKEVLNFQQAIDVAYRFYLAHPEETLIVITADHDTGGMALGRADNRNPELRLADFQKISKDRFSDYCRSLLASGKRMDWNEMKIFLQENLGFWGAVKISDKDEERLHADFDKVFVNREGKDEKGLYNDFNFFAVEVYDIFNRALGIGWTTTNHTGNFVPVYALGEGSDLFKRNLNNIEIPMLILQAAGIAKTGK